MAKGVFIGRNDLSNIFAILGIDILWYKELDLERLKDYDLILTEDSFFTELREKFPEKTVVSLVDFEGLKNSLTERTRDFIIQTVGEEVLRR